MCGFVVYEGKKEELKEFDKEFAKLAHRGPDDSQIHEFDGGVFGFHRLSIMDLSDAGNQPFVDKETGNILVCNGEVYNSEELRETVKYPFKSGSDCEVILPLYRDLGLAQCARALDSEFAFVIWDEKQQKYMAARDPIGIRPLFYGRTEEGKMVFASEAKFVQAYCKQVMPFPPGHCFDGEHFFPYTDVTAVEQYHDEDMEEVLFGIRARLIDGVRKRLISDAPVGLLLSGGLDSSLVCAIAHRLSDRPLVTFSIGMESDAIDLKYAKDVAEYLGSDHHEVIITKEDVLGALKDVIWHLETFDITTIRASIGMYLVCKYIREKTDIKVLLTGEVSDEIFGYKYTDFAPSAQAFQEEAEKRVKELYMYDVLRADRCISAHSLEARVPFSDKEFVNYVMGIKPEMKMNKYDMGKYLLRAAFEKGDYLPEHILWREKAAFSDAVGHSLVDYLKEYAEELYSTNDVKQAKLKYAHSAPISKESLMYREIFDSLYPGQAHLIKSFWMPNQEWENCQVDDPSARVLPNYGASGQ